MNSSGRIYEFGPFLLDIGERRLVRNGRPVPLRAKVFDTLCVLVENHGRLVAKEALMKAVWPDALVEEGNLAHNIAALRKALGSSEARSDHVETIPGQGYRFVASITEVRDLAAQSETLSGFRASQADLSWDERLEAARAALASTSGTEVLARTRHQHVVGRRREIIELAAAVESARSGRGLVLGLTGEPGIGKSTLVELFLADQQTWGSDCLVAIGRCSELLGTSDAYLPVLDALEGLLRDRYRGKCGDLLKLVAPTWFLRLQPLWAAADPSFASIAADAKTASRERMKRELVTFIEEVSHARPLVLIVDDLHWADASTVEFIEYLSRKFEALRTLVLIAYRQEEMIRTRHPFLAVRHALQRRGRFQEVSLGLLSQDDIEHYLSLELPQAHLSANFVEFVHRRTEGNPLFVTDLVKHLREQGVLSERAGQWRLTRSVDAIGRDVPESARSIIERRLDQLSEREMVVLMAASVQGHQFESRIVADVSETDAADVEDRLRDLERVHGFVRVAQERQLPDSSFSLSYTFAHVLYQHAIVEALTPSRRAELSRRTAESLLRRYENATSTVASQLALLFEVARDFEHAADFFLLAATNAAALFANEEAVGLSRRAIACAEKLDGLARHSRVFKATLEMAQLHMVLSRFEDAVTNFQAAERTAVEACDIDGQIRAVCGRSMGLFTLQRLDGMRIEGERAVRLAQRSTSQTAKATADTVLAMARMNAGDLEAAEQCFSRAIPLLRQEGLWVQSLDAISFRGLLHHMRLEFEHVEQTSGWAIEQAKKLGATFYVIENLFYWGMALANRGRLTDAMKVLRDGIRVAELNGERYFIARLSNTLAWLYREIHDVEASLRLGTEAVSRASEMQVRDAEVHAHINLAGDYLELADPVRAGEHLRRAQRLVTQDHIFQWRQMIRVEEVAAAFWLAAGDIEKAAAYAISALEHAKQTLSRKHIAWSRKLLGDVAAHQERYAEAVRSYELALKVVDSYPCPLVEWKIVTALAGSLRSSRQLARAGDLRQRALSVKRSLAESISDDTLRRGFLSGHAQGVVA
jgi:DNA-binding winged helix-turn-helix (wHTH) protein/tetratricopeptide (TPR) repeat protein